MYPWWFYEIICIAIRMYNMLEMVRENQIATIYTHYELRLIRIWYFGNSQETKYWNIRLWERDTDQLWWRRSPSCRWKGVFFLSLKVFSQNTFRKMTVFRCTMASITTFPWGSLISWHLDAWFYVNPLNILFYLKCEFRSFLYLLIFTRGK